jgi:hypothetical protein
MIEPLTDAEVQAGAQPGESWDTARLRLTRQRDRLATWPRQVYHCACWELHWSRLGLGWVIEDPLRGILFQCDGCHDIDATWEEPEEIIY